MLNLLPAFPRFQVIDINPFRSLPSSMRWTALIALVLFFPVAPASAQTSTGDQSTKQSAPKRTKAPTHLPDATAEPENPNAYAPPVSNEREGPSDADVGPVQKHFIRASTTDNLASTENEDNATLAMPEKIALDKHISVPLIHDIQNDGDYAGGNDALNYEIKYINWGAVTQEQMDARRGHYFTITWDNDGPKSDFTARFEYRQVKSKEIVRTLTQKVSQAHGSTRSYFAVVDKAYLAYGPVCSWRFTILKGDTIVAEAKSFIW